MAHAAESLRRAASHPLARAVRAQQLRVGAFQLQQLPVEAVVDRVLHHRSVEHVIGVGGAVEQAAQFGGTGLLGGTGPRGGAGRLGDRGLLAGTGAGGCALRDVHGGGTQRDRWTERSVRGKPEAQWAGPHPLGGGGS